MTTHRFYFAASPDRAARLAEECGRREIAVAASPEDATRVIVVSALAKPDIAAAADILRTLDDGAIVAAEMPPNFPFNDALLARAEEIWNRPPLAIPPLQTAADTGRAMDIIAAADAESEDAKSAAQTAVAAARRALDDIL